jgi:protein-S-isoprenylcysteine O-methyltransferase Ste14
MSLTPLLAYAGGVLRLATRRILGRIGSRHAVRLVRSPAYAGTIVVLVGLVVFLTNPISAVPLLFLVAAVEWRIKAEDRRAYAHGRVRR